MSKQPKSKKDEKPEVNATTITIPAMNIMSMQLVLVGDTGLIVHAWSEKAKKEMLGKQMGKARGKKEKKDPHAEFLGSLYRLGDDAPSKYGFPILAFKKATVSACRLVDGIPMTLARQVIHVSGEDMAPLYGDEPVMREDMVRLKGDTADIRFRGEFRRWWTMVGIEFDPNVISQEQVINLFNLAGFSVGVGEWRPEKGGRNGRFHVASQAEVEALGL